MAKNSRTKNSMLNLLTGFGGQIVTTVLAFVTRTVFIHTLGKAYLGINGLFSNILSMLSLTELGLGTAIAYMLYKPLAVNDIKRVRVLLKFYKTAYRIIGVIIFVLGLGMIPFLSLLIKDYNSLEALGINAVLLFLLFLFKNMSSYLFFAYRSSVMRANQKRYIIDLIGICEIILVNITEIIGLVLFKSFILYTATAIVFVILKNIVTGIIIKKKYPDFFEKEEDSLSKQEIISLFKDCGALFVFKVNTVVLKATDNIVLSAYVGLSIVGLYSNYLLLYHTCGMILKQFSNAIRAGMGNIFAVESTTKKYAFFQISNFAAAVLYGTAGVGVAVCSNELINLWVGKDYIIPQPFPILIGIELLFAGIINNLAQIREVSGVFRQMWYRPIIGVIINLTVSIVLVQFIGIYGVIIGTIASYVFANLLFDPKLIHKYTFDNHIPVIEYYKKNLLYFGLIILVYAIDMLVCSNVLTGHGWLSLIFHVIFTGISVPIVFYFFFHKTNECMYLTKMLIRIIKKIPVLKK